jgi:hypothetical protein
MNFGWIAMPALAALIAAAPPASNGTGHFNRAFPAVRPFPAGEETRSARHCTSNRDWCALLSRDSESGPWGIDISQGGRPPRRLILPGQEAGDARFALRPVLTREAQGAALIGIERTRTTGYAGGGASVTSILLMRAEAGAAPAVVLDLPMRGHASIRACFGARDERARAGACHDEYEMAGEISLDPGAGAGRPRFIMTARARTFPGRRSRFEDSTRAPRLRRSDLVWASDPACTYRRILAFDPAEGRYVPDAALPDCSDYLDIGD